VIVASKLAVERICLCGYIGFMKELAQLYKALADETRLRIVFLLQTGGELCVCDLMAVLNLPQSTVSRHLAYLRGSGLVRDTRKGVWMYYRLREQEELSSGVLDSLKEQFPRSKTAAADRQRLLEYLGSKKANACATRNRGEQ
jgi:ArsR family transcriptional regulator